MWKLSLHLALENKTEDHKFGYFPKFSAMHYLKISVAFYLDKWTRSLKQGVMDYFNRQVNKETASISLPNQQAHKNHKPPLFIHISSYKTKDD